MSRIFLICWMCFTTSIAFSQTALPTSWDCTTGTTPNFWTTNSSSYYTSSSYLHSMPNALKFEATGAYLSIYFADTPDTLLYYLRGASFVGGTFLIQHSANGSSWTSIRTFTDANIPNTSLTGASPFIDILPSTARYVRFYYSYKSAGNVSLDDIYISRKAAGPEAEIAVRVNDLIVQTGQTAITGNAVAVPCKIYNSGSDSVLRISGHSITGTDASMFSLSGLPATVAAGDSASVILNFAASGIDGTKTATLIINNNDSDENPYTINLWAVKGCCATEPANGPVNLNFSLITSYNFRLGFANGVTIPDKFIVLKKSSPITETPVDGQSYIKGSYVGNAKVCYSGPAAYFYPADVVAGATYYVKVFPVNGYPGYENYLTTNPATGQVTTLSNMIGTYYDALDLGATDFRTELHNLINPHNNLYFSDYSTTVLSTVIYRDTVENGSWRKMAKCAYSNVPYIYADPFAWTVLSREHNFCQSWMPTSNDANFDQLPEYSDYHNLVPVHQNNVNSYRNNYPLGEVVNVTYTYGDSKMGEDASGNVVFEPRDEVKGDCARAMFYMVLCYDGISGNNWGIPESISSVGYGQDLAVLKSWSQADPPSAYEIAKNDYIYSIQGNRNPFIDSIQWVDQIDFTLAAGFSKTGKDDTFQVYPNPANDAFFVQSKTTKNEEFSFELCNYSGAPVVAWPMAEYGSLICIPRENLPAGLYTYRILSASGAVQTGKLIFL